MTLPVIRDWRDGDAAAAIALWHAAGIALPWNDLQAEIAAALSCSSAALIVATIDDVLIGTVQAGYDGHRGWLYNLAVADSARQRGVGRALVEAAETWLTAQGAPRVRLMVRNENEAATGFYAALGYERQAVLVMGKALDGS